MADTRMQGSPGEGPATLPIRPGQPMPVHASVVAVVLDGGIEGAAVVREWESRKAIAACGLCTGRPCVAVGLTCLMVVGKPVTKEEAYLFKDEGCVWVTRTRPASAPAAAPSPARR